MPVLMDSNPPTLKMGRELFCDWKIFFDVEHRTPFKNVKLDWSIPLFATILSENIFFYRE